MAGRHSPAAFTPGCMVGTRGKHSLREEDWGEGWRSTFSPLTPPQADWSLLLFAKCRQAIEHPGGKGNGVSKECGQCQAEHHRERGHPGREKQPSNPGSAPHGMQGCSSIVTCIPAWFLRWLHHHNTPGASSPAVESSFLPGPQLVRPRGDGVRELDELAAERGFAQEQDKGVEPPDRTNQS